MIHDAFRPVRSHLLWVIACLFAMILAACGPQATPTSQPTRPPATEVEEEATEAADDDTDADATEAADDGDADATEAADDADTDATEAADDDDSDATEAADDADADATEAADDDADADATEEAADDAGSATTSGDGFPATVGVSTVRMRAQPMVSADQVAELTRDTQVTVLGQTADQGYALVRMEDGTEGWVAKQTLQFEERYADIPVVTP